MSKRRASPLLLVLLVTASLLACSDAANNEGSSETTSTSTSIAEAQDLAELVQLVGCTDLREIHPDVGPVRAMADRGLVCTATEDRLLHLFVRSSRFDYGSVENIERLLGIGISTAGCDVSVLVTDRFVIVAEEPDLDSLGDIAGERVRPIEAASPTVSYLSPDCRLTAHGTWEEPTDL